jgi:predicted RNA-binding Zn-ribbon protein involved in translation (DUF1610 family)
MSTMSTATHPISNLIFRPLDSLGLRGQHATSYNFRTCEACGHNLREQMPELGAQIWACSECGNPRQWGFSRAEDKRLKAALHCDQCGDVTRHGYVGVIGGLS